LSLMKVEWCADRGLCDGSIPHPGESYRICLCVIECG